MVVTPAYGRDYKSGKEAKEDFLAGKDFIIADMFSRWDGKPCSIRDFDEGELIEIRYAKLRKLVMVTVKKEK